MRDRERMKLLAITNKIFYFAKKQAEVFDMDFTGVLGFQTRLEAEQTIRAMTSIPAKLFRKDKPEIDMRRYKRYHKNGKLVKSILRDE